MTAGEFFAMLKDIPENEIASDDEFDDPRAIMADVSTMISQRR